MPKATQTPTTPNTRRGLLGFLAGMVPAALIGRAAVTPACAVSRSGLPTPLPPLGGDDTLIKLCREYFQLWDQEYPLIIVMWNADDETADAAYDTCCGLWDAKAVLVDRITHMRARTEQGTWAKAAVTGNAIRHRDYDAKGERHEDRSPEERLALSLCRDLGV